MNVQNQVQKKKRIVKFVRKAMLHSVKNIRPLLIKRFNQLGNWKIYQKGFSYIFIRVSFFFNQTNPSNFQIKNHVPSQY